MRIRLRYTQGILEAVVIISMVLIALAAAFFLDRILSGWLIG